MYTYNLDPVLLHLGPLEIRWYGLVYVLGFFLTILWLQHLRKKSKLSLNSEEIWDLIFYVMVGVLIGSRLFEVFWEPTYYLSNPLRFLKIWEGGMSFHGGFVGSVIAGWLYCHKKKISFWNIADAISTPAIFALGLGRIANFTNGELVGRAWDSKWCVTFPAYDDLCRHPQVLYSAVQRVLLSGWLAWLQLYHEFTPGFIFWNLVFWEGLGRFIIDFVREDALYLGFTVGQWFSLMMIFTALWIFNKKYKNDWKIIFSIKREVLKKEDKA